MGTLNLLNAQSHEITITPTQAGPSPQVDVAFVLAPWTPSDKRIARLINFVDQGPNDKGTRGFG